MIRIGLVCAALLGISGCAALDQRAEMPHPWDGVAGRHRSAVGFVLGLGGSLAALNIVDHNDKTAHAWAGFAAASSLGLTLQPVDGWIVGVGLGVLKEASDSRTHEPDGMDVLATAAGATLAWCLTSLCWDAQ